MAYGEIGYIGPALKFALGEKAFSHRPHAGEVICGQLVVCDKPVDVNAAHLYFVAIAVPEWTRCCKLHGGEIVGMRLLDWDVDGLATVDGESLAGQAVFWFVDGSAVFSHQYNVIFYPSFIKKCIAAPAVGGIFRQPIQFLGGNWRRF